MHNITILELIEYIGSLLGIIAIILNAKENYWCFIIGLANTLIYIFINIEQKLYGVFILNLYYTILNISGWIEWTKKYNSKKVELKIAYLTPKNKIITFCLCILISFLIFYINKFFINGQLVFLDTITTSFAFVAMWLSVKKKIDSWYYWILSNFFGFYMYFYLWFFNNEKLIGTTILFITYLIIAPIGLYNWIKLYKKNLK